MYAKDKAKHNTKIWLIGLVSSVITLSCLLGMWVIVILEFNFKWNFIVPMAITGFIAYGVAWMICSMQIHSIGLEIETMDDDECAYWIIRLNRRKKHIAKETGREIEYLLPSSMVYQEKEERRGR